ncbi:hypothetical protein [Halorubrum aethiopicum]|uniref:hypothetical protein n=1 Tax=Halorubrum aethiopicum TaxID=1758255 RepID=UPI00083341F5|nr:hypothetical protein [Halorubrum aethiopicum]
MISAFVALLIAPIEMIVSAIKATSEALFPHLGPYALLVGIGLTLVAAVLAEQYIATEGAR